MYISEPHPSQHFIYTEKCFILGEQAPNKANNPHFLSCISMVVRQIYVNHHNHYEHPTKRMVLCFRLTAILMKTLYQLVKVKKKKKNDQGK